MNLIEPILSAVVEIMKCSCAPIFRRLGYIKDLERNFERLNEKARALYDKKEDIQHEIRRHGNEKTPTSQCQSWISKVDEIQNQVNAIEEEYSKGDKRCLRRWCLDIPSSWRLGRRIVEKMNFILNLIEESNFEGGVVVDALPQIVETMPVTTVEDGTSTERTLKKILECMRNERTQKIGIWGMGASLRKEDSILIWENAVQELSAPATSDIYGFSMGRDEIEKDVVISGGIISRLSQLEQLSIDLSSTESQFGHEWNKWAEALLKDVSYMKGLMSLEFYFPQLESLECFLQTIRPWKEGRFTSFNFNVGSYSSRSGTTRGFGYKPELGRKNRILTICGCDGISSATLEVLSHTDRFKFCAHRSIHCLCELGMQNMRRLTSCIISECDAMEIFIEGDQLIEAALPKLTFLRIYDMLNLKSIWEGSFPPGSFNCLSRLNVSRCNKLKNIFPSKIITQLSNLRVLQVESCSALEEVICEEAIGVKSDCVLPKLRILELESLPALVGILKAALGSVESLSSTGIGQLEF
ncbi:hypothetical protein AAC387_Pa05g0635 [Persea americana]